MLITGPDPTEKNIYIKKILFQINNGVKLIQLRAKELSKNDYFLLAQEVIEIGKKYNVKVVLNTDLDTATALDADGIHLTSHQLMQHQQRLLPFHKIVSAACHDQIQLLHAKHIQVDFAIISPVLKTKSHPDANPLGWDKFAALCRLVSIPIYALGGMSRTDVATAMAHGGIGIAAIHSLWDEYK